MKIIQIINVTLKNWKVYLAKNITMILVIAIGIFPVAALAGIDAGGKHIIHKTYEDEKLYVVDVQTNQQNRSSYASYMSLEDGKLIKDKIPEVKEVIPIIDMSGFLETFERSQMIKMKAVGAGYEKYANIKILKGRFINTLDIENKNEVVVIDDVTADKLFGTTNVIGRSLTAYIGSSTFKATVIGICQNENRDIKTIKDGIFDGSAYLPACADDEIGMDDSVAKIAVVLSQNMSFDDAQSEILQLMDSAHGNSNYEIEKYEQISRVSDLLDQYVVFIIIISVIAMLIGTVSLSGSMASYVKSNTYSLSLKKFYGANMDVVGSEILYESLILCLWGAFFGLVAGIAAGYCFGAFINISPYVDFQVMAIVLAQAVVIGTLSAVLPIRKAGKIDIREVL